MDKNEQGKILGRHRSTGNSLTLTSEHPQNKKKRGMFWKQEQLHRGWIELQESTVMKAARIPAPNNAPLAQLLGAGPAGSREGRKSGKSGGIGDERRRGMIWEQ